MSTVHPNLRNGRPAAAHGGRGSTASFAGSTASFAGSAAPFAIAAALAVLLGILGGVGAFTFGYGKGWSYLSNDPAVCANCHVMNGHFESWQNSSHHHAAVCNDCHLPHTFFGKWITKGDNGFFHSLAFTLGNFHEPIRIKPRNRRVAQGACLHCHAEFVHQILPTTEGGEAPLCVTCHHDVGHALR